MLFCHKEVNYFETKWTIKHKLIINFDKGKVLNINFCCNPVSLILRLENTHVLKIQYSMRNYLGVIL